MGLLVHADLAMGFASRRSLQTSCFTSHSFSCACLILGHVAIFGTCSHVVSSHLVFAVEPAAPSLLPQACYPKPAGCSDGPLSAQAPATFDAGQLGYAISVTLTLPPHPYTLN